MTRDSIKGLGARAAEVILAEIGPGRVRGARAEAKSR
jgi:hypothetical protein